MFKNVASASFLFASNLIFISANAQSIELTYLPISEINYECESALRNQGIKCLFAPEELQGKESLFASRELEKVRNEMRRLSLPVTSDRLEAVERIIPTRFFGLAVIIPRTWESDIKTYEVQSFFVADGTLVSIDPYRSDIPARIVAQHLQTFPMDQDAEKSYVAAIVAKKNAAIQQAIDRRASFEQANLSRQHEQEAAAIAEAERREFANSPVGKRVQAALDILQCDKNIRNARSMIEHEREVGRISGYENKETLYNAGNIIVYNQKMAQSAWKVYWANGGQAKTLQELQRTK